jgi:HEAT repeat protein
MRWDVLTSDVPYVDLIGSCLSASSLYTVRQVDLCHQQAYDRYLIETLAKEKLCQHKQVASQVEAAVHAVTQIAKGSSFLVGDASTIAALAALLEHRHDGVRTAAVDAFLWIGARGDSGAIAAVAKRFGNADKEVRHAAMNALANIAERGNGTAIVVVVAGLEDAEPSVRVAAVRAFAHIAEKEDVDATAAVIALLEDTIGNVRCAALHTLKQIVKRGDATAIAAVTTRLEDPCEDVRKAAVKTLAQIVETGDAGAIAAVSLFLEHGDERVRVAAVYALAQIEEKGNAATIAAIAACFKDSEIAVRNAAVKVFPQISEKGNSAAIVALAECLEDRSVRHAVGEVLLQMTEGNERIIAALSSIADIKSHLTAALRIPNEGEVEAVVVAAESLEDAKQQLSLHSHLFMMSNLSRLAERFAFYAREAASSTAIQESQSAGGTRTAGTSFCDLLRHTRILNRVLNRVLTRNLNRALILHVLVILIGMSMGYIDLVSEAQDEE